MEILVFAMLGSKRKTFVYILCYFHCIFSDSYEFVCIYYLYRVKTYIWYYNRFGFKGMPLWLRGFVFRPVVNLVIVGDLHDQLLWGKEMKNNRKIKIEKFNYHSFELWNLNMEDLLMDKH